MDTFESKYTHIHFFFFDYRKLKKKRTNEERKKMDKIGEIGWMDGGD